MNPGTASVAPGWQAARSERNVHRAAAKPTHTRNGIHDGVYYEAQMAVQDPSLIRWAQRERAGLLSLHGVELMQIGIDLGGTKIEAIALAADSLQRGPPPRPHPPRLRTHHRRDRPVGCRPRIGSRPARHRRRRHPRRRLPQHRPRQKRQLHLAYRPPPQTDLEARLNRPVQIANDANCFALSEAIDGAGQGFETVFGVILGTGVGGGIAIRQRIHDGPNQIAGEWGHNPLPWMTDEERAAAPPCYCGKTGCIETFLSGPGFERDYALLSGTPRSSQDIVRAAAAGDPHAIAALRRYEDRLARALATVINILDPDAIVLGGGMSNLPDLASATSALLPRYVFSDTVFTKILPNAHGDSSGVRGAAWLWPLP